MINIVNMPLNHTREYLNMSVSMFEFVSKAKLPTRFGEFTIHGFVDMRNQQEHVALSYGEWQPEDAVHIRVHSECLT